MSSDASSKMSCGHLRFRLIFNLYEVVISFLYLKLLCILDKARYIKYIIPGSSLHIIPQAGHFLMEDNPKEVSEIIETFIRKKSWPINGIK